jgi:hypothetical protein
MVRVVSQRSVPHDPSQGDLARRRTPRSLSEEVLRAFHHACDVGDFECAQTLLTAAETSLRPQVALSRSKRNRLLDGLVAGHERLWFLKRTQPRPAPTRD